MPPKKRLITFNDINHEEDPIQREKEAEEEYKRKSNSYSYPNYLLNFWIKNNNYLICSLLHRLSLIHS